MNDNLMSTEDNQDDISNEYFKIAKTITSAFVAKLGDDWELLDACEFSNKARSIIISTKVYKRGGGRKTWHRKLFLLQVKDLAKSDGKYMKRDANPISKQFPFDEAIDKIVTYFNGMFLKRCKERIETYEYIENAPIIQANLCRRTYEEFSKYLGNSITVSDFDHSGLMQVGINKKCRIRITSPSIHVEFLELTPEDVAKILIFLKKEFS